MTEREQLNICGLGFWTGVILLNPPLVIGSIVMTGVVKINHFLRPR